MLLDATLRIALGVVEEVITKLTRKLPMSRMTYDYKTYVAYVLLTVFCH